MSVVALVRFRTSSGDYAVRVESAREVLPAGVLTRLPSAAEGVVGVLDRERGPVTVVTALGEGRDHILVLEVDGRTFGLLVDVVLGVIRIEQDLVEAPPPGQDQRLVDGVLTVDGTLVLLVDAAALANSLLR